MEKQIEVEINLESDEFVAVEKSGASEISAYNILTDNDEFNAVENTGASEIRANNILTDNDEFGIDENLNEFGFRANNKLNDADAFGTEKNLDDFEIRSSNILNDTDAFGADKNVDFGMNDILTVPVKLNKKNYEKEKVKLYSETQRLLRETNTTNFKYKPKTFKTMKELKEALSAKSKKDSSSNSVPLASQLSVENSALSKSKKRTDKLDEFLKQKFSSTQNIYLKNAPEDYSADKQKANLYFERLRRKGIPSQHTGGKVLNISVKKSNSDSVQMEELNIGSKEKKVILAGQVDPLLSNCYDEHISQMTPAQKIKKHKQLLLLEATKKSREARQERMKEFGVEENVNDNENKVEKAKKNDDGLSDDDWEYKVTDDDDNGAATDDDNDSESDSDSDSDVDEVKEEDEEDEDDIVTIKSKSVKKVLESDDEDECQNAEKMELSSVLLNGNTINNFDFSCTLNESVVLKNYIRDKTTGVPRPRNERELSPCVKRQEQLMGIKLPAMVGEMLEKLKNMFGFRRHLVSGDSSILLFPKMKTTTVCIEEKIKQQLLNGKDIEEAMEPWNELLSSQHQSNHGCSDILDEFNLLGCVAGTDDKGFYSFRTTNDVADATSVWEENNSDLVITGKTNNIFDEDSNDTVILGTNLAESATVVANEDDTIILGSLPSQKYEGDKQQNTLKAATVVANEDDTIILGSFTSQKYEGDKKQNTQSRLQAIISDDDDDDRMDYSGQLERAVKESGFQFNAPSPSVTGVSSADTEILNTDDENNEEEEDDDGDGEQFIKDSDNEDDEEEQLRQQELNGGVPVKKFWGRAKEFLDEEAELSGSDADDYGPDENEEGLDEYDEALLAGGEDLPSEGRLRREIARVHNRMEADEDARQLGRLKEMLLEDGDLYLGSGELGQRQRRIEWPMGGEDANDAWAVAMASIGKGADESDGEDSIVDERDDEAAHRRELEEQNSEKLEEEMASKFNSESVEHIWKPRLLKNSTESTGTNKSGHPKVKHIRKHGSLIGRNLTHLASFQNAPMKMDEVSLKDKMARHTFSVIKKKSTKRSSDVAVESSNSVKRYRY